MMNITVFGVFVMCALVKKANPKIPNFCHPVRKLMLIQLIVNVYKYPNANY